MISGQFSVVPLHCQKHSPPQERRALKVKTRVSSKIVARLKVLVVMVVLVVLVVMFTLLVIAQ